MAKNRKTENGISYRIESRSYPDVTQATLFWRGSDGSELELTEDELLERDTSRSVTD